MAEDGAFSELRCRPKHQSSMPFLHDLINLILACVGAASYPDELTATLESSQIAIVIALLQQAAGEPDVIHGQSPTHRRAPAEPSCSTSVDIYCNVERLRGAEAMASDFTSHQLLALCTRLQLMPRASSCCHVGVGESTRYFHPPRVMLINAEPTKLIQRCSGVKECDRMTEVIDELGPVDWLVVEFPGSKFNGEIAPEITDLVDRKIIRVLDLLVLRKDTDGSLEAFEITDLGDDELGELRAYETELAMLLSVEDVEAIAAAVEPGSTAACLVWENLWAAPFASAVRRAGGQLVANGRIPVQALLASIEAEAAAAERETELEKEGA